MEVVLVGRAGHVILQVAANLHLQEPRATDQKRGKEAGQSLVRVKMCSKCCC